MHWLLINATDSEARIVAEDNYNIKFKTTVLAGAMLIYYDERIWSSPPLIAENECKLIVCGWFVYKDKLNNLNDLFIDIKKNGLTESIQNIEMGNFIGYYEDDNDFQIFNDFLGLSAHYISWDLGTLRISPSAQSLSGDLTIDEENAKYLKLQGHLWGDRTLFKGVKRLLGGLVMDGNGQLTDYRDFDKVQSLRIEDIPKYMKKVCDYFPKSYTCISLSAGFDSRLIATLDCSASSYTWGPITSKDQINASQIAKSYKLSHASFLFRQVDPTKEERDLVKWLTGGQVWNHDPQFLTNYHYAAKLHSTAYVALDGFIGDVFQRGIYFHYSGIKGELKKLVPWMFTSESPSNLIAKRYKALPSEGIDTLINDYNSYTLPKGSDKFTPQMRYVMQEVFFGRGQYIASGGITCNGVFNVVVAPFATPAVLKSSLSESVSDVLTYRTFKKFWFDIDSSIKSLVSEGSYSVETPRPAIPILNFFGRLATHFIPKYRNYSKQ